jgi:tRNA (guanine37-N1)-methyltransferase
MLVFGTGHGLAPDIYASDRPSLAPVRAGQYNHLSVRTAAAITLDRLIGERGSVLPLFK